MSQEELTDLEILGILYKYPEKEFSYKDFRIMVNGIIDDSRGCLNSLIQRNIISSDSYVDFLNQDQRFKIGINADKRLYFLRKRKRNETVASLSLFLTLIFSAIAAVYAAITYHASENTNSQKPLKVELQQAQPSKDLRQSRISDSAKIHQN